MAKDDNDSNGSQKVELSERDIKLLFVTQKESALASTLRFLTKRQWQHSVVESIKDALDLMQGPNKPTHIFISFSTPTNLKKIEALFKNTFNVIPILFSETFESTTYSQMRKVGFEHTILSPVSGPTVQMKVRNTTHVKEENAPIRQKGSKRSSSEDSAIVDESGPQLKCSPDDLPAAGHWMKMLDRNPPVWRLSTYLEMKFEEKEGNFYYEGLMPPTLAVDGKWVSTEENGRLYFIAKTIRSKKEKKRNWWENDGGEAERDGTRKAKAYKFVIEESSDDETREGDAEESRANFIHVKGEGVIKPRLRERSGGVEDNSRIIIRESKRHKKTSLILEAKGPEASNFEGYDKEGKVHPFFEQVGDETLSDESSSAGKEVSIHEQSGARVSERGPSDIFKGQATRGETSIEKGERVDVNSILQKGEQADTDPATLERYEAEKKRRLEIFKKEQEKQLSINQERPESSDEDDDFAPIQAGSEKEKGAAYEPGQEEDAESLLAKGMTAESSSMHAKGERGKGIGKVEGGASEGEEEKNSEVELDPETLARVRAEKEKASRQRAFGKKLHSILAESSIKALESVAVRGEEMNEIRNTKRLGVIPVKTPTTKGVLLVAMGDNKGVGEVLLKELKEKLMHHLRLRGQDLTSHGDLEIMIDEVDFVDWGKVETEFMALDQIGNDQVGVAFLSGDDIIPEVSQSAEAHMLAVDLECILPDAAITFDIYIYMPTNKRYIRYVKKGQRIDPSQIERLRNFETEYFHIRKEDLKNFQAYCAANYINVLIRGSRISKAS